MSDLAELKRATPSSLTPLAYADVLAISAVRALIDEAELTPKPALVDQRGSGAHVDLDLPLMRRSATALQTGFVRMARVSIGQTPSQLLREHLARIGRDTEQTMLAVTDDSNAHRGAIWILGLLIAAASIHGQGAPAPLIVGTAARIAKETDRWAPMRHSHGARVQARYGVAGARGEAINGFPHVMTVGLPMLHACRARGECEEDAMLNTLMAIIAKLDDTCLLHRGGQEALSTAQQGAHAVLAQGGVAHPSGKAALLQLDRALLARNASPGGSADLLAATLFLDRIPSRGTPMALRPIRSTQHNGNA